MMLPVRTTSVSTPRRAPTADELQGRIALARAVISHRMDPLNPDVIVLGRALLGWSTDELAEGERRR